MKNISKNICLIKNSNFNSGLSNIPFEWLLFSEPVEILSSYKLEEIHSTLIKIENFCSQGLWAVGYVNYEASPYFDYSFKIKKCEDRLPILWFGIYKKPILLNDFSHLINKKRYTFKSWTSSVNYAEYEEAIRKIKNYICAGDTYQVNYTYNMHSHFGGDPLFCFRELQKNQASKYSAYIENDFGYILSASPELFFYQNNDFIISRPMKGTFKRGLYLEDDKRNEGLLKNSEKDKAENLMITDLIRNDIGRVALYGTVKVDSLFDIEKYETVFQMTSTISAKTDKHPLDVFSSLFPCGSVTGAPKIRTMEIIAELEKEPRGIYTGAIGYFGPDKNACFNVAIRTIFIKKDNNEAIYGVGGGIVADSDSVKEFNETITKSQILFRNFPEFCLLETIRWSPEEGFFLLDEHIKRMKNSATYFDFKFDEKMIIAQLKEREKTFPENTLKIRLLLARDGSIEIQFSSFKMSDDLIWTVALASEPIDCDNPFFYHKTTNREIYDNLRKDMKDVDEVILYNKNNEITEGTITNVVVEINGKKITPPVSSGLLAGTFREYLLEKGIIYEGIIYIDELKRADQIWLINSLRGWIKAILKNVS